MVFRAAQGKALAHLGLGGWLPPSWQPPGTFTVLPPTLTTTDARARFWLLGTRFCPLDTRLDLLDRPALNTHTQTTSRLAPLRQSGCTPSNPPHPLLPPRYARTRYRQPNNSTTRNYGAVRPRRPSPQPWRSLRGTEAHKGGGGLARRFECPHGYAQIFLRSSVLS